MQLFKWIVTNILLPFLFVIAGVTATYYIENKKREPTFYVEPLKTFIAQKQNLKTQSFKILRKDGREISDDLISETFYFFNQGEETIKDENIYSPITIKLSNLSSKFIDYKIIKVHREESQIRSYLDTVKNEITIEFVALEKYDGIVGQVIYEGESDLIIKGGIEGITSIKRDMQKTYWTVAPLIIASFLLFFGVLPHFSQSKFGMYIRLIGLMFLILQIVLLLKKGLNPEDSVPETLYLDGHYYYDPYKFTENWLKNHR